MARVMAWNVNENHLLKVSIYANLSGLTRAEIVDEALYMYFKNPNIRKELKKLTKAAMDLIDE